MRRLLTFVVVLLAITECGSEGNAENPFQEHNPDYRTRAGTFYEKAYLPGATKGLICVFAPQELSEKKARQILRQFIYNFLDQYIADGGAITRRNHARILARLDSRVKELADGPSILKNYEAWKSGSSGKFPNPLAFLTKVAFQSPPVMLTLNRELQQQGWRVQSMESLRCPGGPAGAGALATGRPGPRFAAAILTRSGGCVAHCLAIVRTAWSAGPVGSLFLDCRL